MVGYGPLTDAETRGPGRSVPSYPRSEGYKALLPQFSTIGFARDATKLPRSSVHGLRKAAGVHLHPSKPALMVFHPKIVLNDRTPKIARLILLSPRRR